MVSLESCWAKLDRAKEHRDILDRYIRETFAGEANRPRIGIRFDARTKEHVLYVSHLPDLSLFLKRVSLCLGDTMHNFRSALDHLTYQLALKHTGGYVKRPKRVQFPIVDQPSYFKSARGDALCEIHPDHQAIIERFQPYNRIAEGRSIGPYFHSFAVLRDLDNTDKHSLLSLVVSPPTSSSAYGGGEALRVFIQAIRQTSTSTVKAAPIELGTELVRAALPPNFTMPEMEVAGSVRPDITLPEGWPVHHVIERVAALIIKVIGEFQPLL